MEPILTANNLSRQVKTADGELTILDDIELSVMPGDAVAITGPSGSGKSTLLGLLAGLEDPSRGSIRLLGHELSELNQDEKAALRAGNVGFVFQAFYLLNGLTAIENVEIALELAGRDHQREAAAELLERVGLAERMNHYPPQLSGGEQQRVALARAFAVNPRVLFADEPTGNLDTASSELVADLFFDLRLQYGSALLLVTHDSTLASRCDRILTLGPGGRLQS
jgi:putative ABC transport system ATP-binding protein